MSGKYNSNNGEQGRAGRQVKACVEKQLWMAGKHATGQSRC